MSFLDAHLLSWPPTSPKNAHVRKQMLVTVIEQAPVSLHLGTEYQREDLMEGFKKEKDTVKYITAEGSE